jgi:hypothetical protein
MPACFDSSGKNPMNVMLVAAEKTFQSIPIEPAAAIRVDRNLFS